MAALKATAAGILALVLLWGGFVAFPYLTSFAREALTSARVQQLEGELAKLRAELEEARSRKEANGASQPRPLQAKSSAPRGTLNIDLVDLLGYTYWLYGISWAPKACFPSFKTLYPSLTPKEYDEMEAKYIADMRRELAGVLNVKPEDIDPARPYIDQPAVRADVMRRRRQQHRQHTPHSGGKARGLQQAGGSPGYEATEGQDGYEHQLVEDGHGYQHTGDGHEWESAGGQQQSDNNNVAGQSAGQLRVQQPSLKLGTLEVGAALRRLVYSQAGHPPAHSQHQAVQQQKAQHRHGSHNHMSTPQHQHPMVSPSDDGLVDTRQLPQQLTQADPSGDDAAPHKLASQLTGTGSRDTSKSQGRVLQQAPQAEAHKGLLSPSELATDPTYLEWRTRLTLLNAAYFVEPYRTPYVTCDRYNASYEISRQQYGSVSCRGLLPDREVLEKMGYTFMPQYPINTLAKHLKEEGLCTSQVFDHHAGWGDWMVAQRLNAKDWATFPTPNTMQDVVVALYDILYERLGAFKKQYFMGVITMQNPSDMYSITDIIFTQKPDLIIETGTANGGSALMWAGIMELAGCPDTARVLTIDVNPPTWDPKQATWGGVVREDPTKHPLWRKRVLFVKGMSISVPVLTAVRTAAATAKKVLVLLDSDHSAVNVLRELQKYCVLVTPGSYCIVQDTKLSRWSTDGPLPAIASFLAQEGKGNFTVDREREPLHTHHAQGYLKRSAPGAAPPQTIRGPTPQQLQALREDLARVEAVHPIP